MQNKALFLDRDGVLNKLVNNRPPWNQSEIIFSSAAKDILQIAISKHYLPIVVTNQPDAGRGKLTYEKLHSINRFICNHLKIKLFYICDHPFDNMCECRKTKPGMLLKASFENNIDLNASFLIGDREKDIQAGINAGCKTVFISDGICDKADFNVINHEQLIFLLKDILK